MKETCSELRAYGEWGCVVLRVGESEGLVEEVLVGAAGRMFKW
jgi:hypothetical protein